MPDFDAVVDEWIADEMKSSPVRATSLGIDGHDDQLGEFDETAIRQREKHDDAWADRLAATADDGLTLDQRLDRDLILSTLRGRSVMRDWEGWRRDPAAYLGASLSGVFTLFLNRTHPEPDLVRFAAARLRQVPEVLAAGRTNLDAEVAAKLFVERGLGQCRAGVAYARNVVPGEVVDAGGRKELADAGEVAAVAFEEFAAFLEDLKERALGPYAIGEERYSALLTEKEKLEYGAQEMRDKGRAAYAELDTEMQEVTSRINGQGDWRAAIEALNNDHPATPEAMRIAYDEATQDARRFMIEHELVTVPEGEQCLVEPSPPFQRPVLAVASYSSPPAFKAGLTGHFFVPYPPDGTSPEEVQARLATNSHSSIPTIAVHEAYPGHHWHLTWIQASGARPIRKVLFTSYFVEGWALYAERLMREHDYFSDPRHDLCHLDARIFRAARIVVDTSLHIGDMSFDEAVQFMQTNASLSEPTARAEVGRYCSWPTQAASYLTGSLEIERIRERYLAAGKGSVREFNDTIAASGGLPIELAERAVLG